jgi:hypothetical protein
MRHPGAAYAKRRRFFALPLLDIKASDAVLTSTIAATNRLVDTVAVQTRPRHLTMVLAVPTGG